MYMTILFRKKKYTDAEVVEAVQCHNEAIIETFYHQCQNYFLGHAGALFIDESSIDDIFQETMIHLWREMETRRILVVDGQVCRMTSGVAEPMTSTLKTFLMAIAKRKYWEQLRRDQQYSTSDLTAIDTLRYADRPNDISDAEVAEQVVADMLLSMTDRCRQILTMFYYEGRTLDDILSEREENTSKIGLKTSKYKCMNRLRQLVQDRLQALGIRY